VTHTVKTFCRNCGACCSMEIDVADNVMVAARPDGSVSPYGAYMCPKGLSALEFHRVGSERLRGSLKRQAEGSFAPIATDDAIAEIGDRLRALVDEHGPRAVAFYHGTAAYRSVLGGLMERAFVSALGTPNFFSTMTIDQSAKWVTMARMGMMASGKHTMRDVDVAILAGGNPLVSHQGAPFALAESGAPARAFEALKARGGRFILVDPRRSETARYADLLIQPLPGHDAEIFAAIAHILLRDGAFDRDFVAKWCNGVEDLRAALAPFTPELAAARADVPVKQIEQAARWLGEAKKPYAGSGSGPSFATHSNTADHMIEVVNALCGGYRRAGDVVRNPGTLRPKDAFEMAVSPTRAFEHEPRCLSHDTGALLGEFPSGLIAHEILADSPQRIRALISFGGDPLRAMGDPAFARAAFDKLDLLVSLDVRMNPTCAASDYVVATTTPFERAEISVPGDALFPEPFVQYAAPVVERAPGVIDEWEFFWGIAGRMGVPLTFKYWNYGLRFEDIAEGLPLSATEKPRAEDLCRFLCANSAVSFEELLASPAGVRPRGGARAVLPAPGQGGRLELCPSDVAAELAGVLEDEPEAGSAYRLTSRRVLQAINGAYVDSKETRRRYPVNFAWMNPQDMADAGIAEHALVEVASEFGALRTRARGEERLRRGVVSITHMFGPLTGSGDADADGGGNVGQLTSLTARREAVNFMPRFSAIPVNVTPI